MQKIQTETVVIGSGPGGYVAAIRAAQLGQKVTIIEKGDIGGICLNVGCIPSKALISVGHRYEEAKNGNPMGIVTQNVSLDFSKAQVFKEKVVHKLTSGVELLLNHHQIPILRGEAKFINDNTLHVYGQEGYEILFKHAIVATGSRPIEIPTFKYSKRVLDSTAVLSLQKVPSKLVVIGGGYIGAELGMAYSNLGADVTILEGSQDILAGFEPQMTRFVKKVMQKQGMTFEVNALDKGVIETQDGVTVQYEVAGKMKKIDADYVLVTVGRKPNTDNLGLENTSVAFADRGLIAIDKQSRTTAPSIFAIGDIVKGPQLAHKASYEGKVAAEVISGHASKVDYRCIPAVCFTTPEMATVGYTEAQAIAEGVEVVTAKMPYTTNGRALALNASEGFVKLVARKSDQLIIGGQIVGEGASDLISEITLAIEGGMTAEDLALTIHAHPTLGEIVMEAAELLIGTPIHLLKK